MRIKYASYLATGAALAFGLVAIAATDPQTPRMTEKTYAGTVEQVRSDRCEICNCVELSLTLKTSAGQFDVKLGPRGYFEEHDFYITRGDTITAIGTRYPERGKEVILANEVRKGGEHLNLRGKYGRPAWIEAHGHTCPVCGN
jgi:hypothetical protein